MKRISIPNIVLTILIFFTILLINLPNHLLAQEDTTPPELVEFSFTPSAIDVSSGPQIVSTTFRVTDDLSGSDHPNVIFYSPSGTEMYVGSTTLISGTPTDGVWKGQVTFPEFTESGIWYVNIYLNDRLYNRKTYSEAELIELGFPTKLEVVSVLDSDGDGIPEDEDTCPFSDLTETVVIDGCDSGVENMLFDDGCTISDLIWQCAEDAKNHGQFNSAVSHILNDLKKDGTISGEEKGEIQICAEGADIP